MMRHRRMGMMRRRRRGPAVLLALLLLAAVVAALALWPAEPLRIENGKPSADAATVSLLLTESGQTVELPLAEYLTGVLAAEVSPRFAAEALCAQAVVARTFTLRRMENSAAAAETRGHAAAVCDDPGHCQAYRGSGSRRAGWGSRFAEYEDNCRRAVAATADQVLVYEGALAATFYHSVCGGRTASAAEVWGRAYPYLIPVKCRWDADAPRYEEMVTLPLAELPQRLGDGTTPCVAIAEGETADELPRARGKTESGRVATVDYGGLTFKATEFRRKLGLNSTDFELRREGELLAVRTRGFGHGVGLCQHGANGMAAAGYDCRRILAHYYPGCEPAIYGQS